MKPIVSLITPTHRTDKLFRLYESIKAQTNKRFEWIIIPNGNADISVIPSEKWIKIIPYTDTNLNIGALKSFGFSQGIGTLLAEVDHDDELCSNCVEQLILNKDKGDFLYSNNLVFDANDIPYTWGPNWNWKYSTFNYKGKDCPINIAFPPYPGNFSWLHWAANHIRVWRKDFYQKIGGHNINLKACDDGDLMCRTMIHGKIHHINEVLYVYYLHPLNSHADPDLHSWIQEHTKYMHHTYIKDMTLAWCANNNYKIIDNEINFVAEPNTVGCILLNNLYKTENIEAYMKRAYEALVPGGIMIVTNPFSIERNYPHITEKQIPFLDKKTFSVNGVNFEANGLNIQDKIVTVFFTKHTPETHIARVDINYLTEFSAI